MRRGFFPGLLAFVILGLSWVIWPRSGNVRRAEEQGYQAGQIHSLFRSSRPGASGNKVNMLKLAAATHGNRELKDFRAAVLSAQALEDPMEQDAAWSRLMDGTRTDQAAILLASLSPEELNGDAARRLFDDWAAANPGEAAVWAQNQGDSKARQAFLKVAALRWTATDLIGAATWARNLPETGSRLEIMRTVASEAVRSVPLEALRLGVELPAGIGKGDLMSRAAAEWAVTDPDGAAKWVEEIEDNPLRQRLTEQVAVAAAEQDPVGAVAIVLERMFPGREQDRAVVSVVQRWVQTDPAAAAAWVSEFPEGALGRDAMDNLVNLWADRDLVASGNWLLTLQEGELRNTGVLAYARRLHRTDPVLAERWEASVPSGQ